MEVLIPFKRPGIMAVLSSLLFQKVSFDVIIRDDGFDSPFDETNDLLITALSKVAKVKIIRNMQKQTNVLNARRELFEESTDDFVVYLDADMILSPYTLYHLHWWKTKAQYTFYQGAVIEVNEERKYNNCINVLGSNLNGKTIKDITNMKTIETYFGNGSIVGYWRKHLEGIWDKIQVDDIGLGGTDALISAMACANNKNHCGIALPFAYGYHVDRNRFRRNWESGADRYVYDKLKSLNIDKQIYNGIYKHLR